MPKPHSRDYSTFQRDVRADGSALSPQLGDTAIPVVLYDDASRSLQPIGFSRGIGRFETAAKGVGRFSGWYLLAGPKGVFVRRWAADTNQVFNYTFLTREAAETRAAGASGNKLAVAHSTPLVSSLTLARAGLVTFQQLPPMLSEWGEWDDASNTVGSTTGFFSLMLGLGTGAPMRMELDPLFLPPGFAMIAIHNVENTAITSSVEFEEPLL